MNVEIKNSEHNQFNDATYRYETIVTEKHSEHYSEESSVVRNLKVFHLGEIGENSYFQVICLKFSFSDEDRADIILLKKLSYLWDNIEILVNKDNKIIRILNLNQLRLEWIVLKEKLSTDYQGDAVNSYFQMVDKLLENEEKICDFLNSYKMLGMIFNGQYGGYNESGYKFRQITENNISFLEELKIIKNENKQEVQTAFAENKTSDYESYKGIFQYENNHLKEAFLDFKLTDKHIKHSLIWIG